MHKIEPYHSWNQYYESSEDELSPYFGKEYNYDLYSEKIYGYYIDPAWDYIGSETLYLKILFTDYDKGFTILEFLGEWNDALYNDIMHLKRNILEHMMLQGINKFILLGDNVLNFHASDDCYYEEWNEEIEEPDGEELPGWIAGVNFRDFVLGEWQKYGLDQYIACGGNLQITNWRTMHPNALFELVKSMVHRRIALI